MCCTARHVAEFWSSKGRKNYLRATEIKVPQEDFRLSMEVDRRSRLSTAWDYTQYRVYVLYNISRETEPSQNKLAESTRNAVMNYFECPNDINNRTFIACSLDLTLALMPSECRRKIQPQSSVTSSMFSSVLTELSSPIKVIASVKLILVWNINYLPQDKWSLRNIL